MRRWTFFSLQHVEIFTALGFGVPGPDPAEQALHLEAGRGARSAVLPRAALGTSGRSFDGESATTNATADAPARGRSGRNRGARVRSAAHAGQTDGSTQGRAGTTFGLADRALPEEVP